MALAVARARLLGAAAIGAAIAGVISGPAAAHVEVEADKAQAGAQNVTLTFKGESESTSAGIKSERVVLPTGIAPADVQLVKAPKGWKFTVAADGFTVAGAPLKAGQDAEWAVRIAQLPSNATTLSFKTLETYDDGKVSRWIDLPKEGDEEPESPAPTIKLKAAAALPTSSPAAAPSADTAAPSQSPPAATPVTEISAAANDASADGSAAAVWVGVVVIVILALGGVLFWRRRSRRSS